MFNVRRLCCFPANLFRLAISSNLWMDDDGAAARERRLTAHIDSFRLINSSFFAVPPSFLLTVPAKPSLKTSDSFATTSTPHLKRWLLPKPCWCAFLDLGEWRLEMATLVSSLIGLMAHATSRLTACLTLFLFLVDPTFEEGQWD